MDPANVYPLRRRVPPPSRQSHRSERWGRATRYGAIDATQLDGILQQVADGKLEQWANLCDFAIGTDPTLLGLHQIRRNRVAQADWIVAPSKFGDQGLAKEAAAFMGEILERMVSFELLLLDMMEAVSPGTSANQLLWERDPSSRIWYVAEHEYVPLNRFEYAKRAQWDLRLRIDNGQILKGPDTYGETLEPGGWVVHQHRARAGTPDKFGLMQSVIWYWMFMRWDLKSWVIFNEKYGHPIAQATVPENSPDIVRDRLQQMLDNFCSEHSMVLEEGDEVTYQVPGTTAGSDIHERLMNWLGAQITKAYAGATDFTDPGTHGSQSAIQGRAGLTIDPIMVVDGLLLMASLRRSIIPFALRYNAHQFGGRKEREIPWPTIRLKTADDEIERDESDKAAEQQEEREAADAAGDSMPREDLGEVRENPEPAQPAQSAAAAAGSAQQSSPTEPANAPVPAEVAKQALNGAQVDSLKQTLIDIANGVIPPAAGRALIVAAFPGVSEEQVSAMVDPIEPRQPQEDPTPQQLAVPRAKPRRRKRSSPLELALRGRL